MTTLAIAFVEYLRNEKGLIEWCRLRPVYFANEGKWEAISPQTARTRFPTEGKIFWWRTKPTRKGSAWVVNYALNTMADANEKPDRFVVDDGYPLPIFVRRGSPADDIALRRSISSGSLAFAAAFPGPVYVKVPSSTSQWVGPLNIDPEQAKDGRFHINRLASEGFIDVHEIPDPALQVIDLIGQEVMVLAPTRELGARTSVFNIQSDEQLLDGVLKRIRKLDANLADSLGVTKNVFGKYVEALQSADLIGEQVQLEDARAHALGRLISQAEEGFSNGKYIADALAELPSVVAHTEAAISGAVDREAQRIHREATARESEALGRAAALESEVARLAEEKSAIAATIKDMSEQVVELQKALATLPLQLETTLREAASAFKQNPAQSLSSAIFLRVLAGNGERTESARPAVRATMTPLSKAQMEYSTPGELAAVCGLQSNQFGLSQETMLVAATLLLKGRPVLLYGPAVEAMLNALANSLYGGNSLRFPVPSSVFGLADMLSLEAIDQSTLRPTGVYLGDALREDAIEDRLTVLSGVDRGPLEVTLGDLVAQYRAEGDDGKSGRSIIATMMPGPSTFRVPLSIRPYIAIVHCEWSTSQSASPHPIPTSRPRKSFEFGNVTHSVDVKLLAFSAQHGVPVGAAAAEISSLGNAFGNSNRGLALWLLARLTGLVQNSTLLTLIQAECAGALPELTSTSNVFRSLENLF
jgi:hypothetical protein